MIEFIFFPLCTVRSTLERRKILMDRMTEIPNRIMLSEVHEVHVNTLSLIVIYNSIVLRIMICILFQDPRVLAERIVHVLKLGLEGLVLKDIDVSIYLWKSFLLF